MPGEGRMHMRTPRWADCTIWVCIKGRLFVGASVPFCMNDMICSSRCLRTGTGHGVAPLSGLLPGCMLSRSGAAHLTGTCSSGMRCKVMCAARFCFCPLDLSQVVGCAWPPACRAPPCIVSSTPCGPWRTPKLMQPFRALPCAGRRPQRPHVRWALPQLLFRCVRRRRHKRPPQSATEPEGQPPLPHFAAQHRHTLRVYATRAALHPTPPPRLAAAPDLAPGPATTLRVASTPINMRQRCCAPAADRTRHSRGRSSTQPVQDLTSVSQCARSVACVHLRSHIRPLPLAGHTGGPPTTPAPLMRHHTAPPLSGVL